MGFSAICMNCAGMCVEVGVGGLGELKQVHVRGPGPNCSFSLIINIIFYTQCTWFLFKCMTFHFIAMPQDEIFSFLLCFLVRQNYVWLKQESMRRNWDITFQFSADQTDKHNKFLLHRRKRVYHWFKHTCSNILAFKRQIQQKDVPLTSCLTWNSSVFYCRVNVIV